MLAQDKAYKSGGVVGIESAGTSAVTKKPGILRAMDNLGHIINELEKQASRLEEKLQLVCVPLPSPDPEGTAKEPTEPCPLAAELLGLVKRFETLRANHESIIGRLDL